MRVLLSWFLSIALLLPASGQTARQAMPVPAQQPLRLGPILKMVKPPGQREQPQLARTGIAQGVRMLDGSRGMMWNGAFYLRGTDGHWRRQGAGAFVARRHFTIRTAPDGSVTNALLRPRIAATAYQAVIHTGMISAFGTGKPSTLPLRPLLPVLNFTVPPNNTALQVYSKYGPVVTHGEFPSNGTWGVSGTFGVYGDVPFEWSTDPSRVKRAVLQISRTAFPASAATRTGWDVPFQGFVAAVEVPGPIAGSNHFDISIAKYDDFTNPQHQKIWVARIVPLDADGELAGQPSNPVFLVTPYVPPFSLPKSNAPAAPPQHPPAITIDSWRPAQNVQNSDEFLGPPSQPSSIVLTVPTPAVVVSGAFPSYVQESVGQASVKNQLGVLPAQTIVNLDWSPPDEGTSAWDAFCDFVSQLGDYISDAVNWVSHAFAAIKNGVVGAIAGLMTGIGLPSSVADLVANAVVDCVMASAGIPPTLPDMAQLENMGIGYVTDLAAEQVGVDPDLVNAAQNVVTPDKIRTGVQQAISNVSTAQAGGASFFMPDPAILYHPPVLMLRVTAPSVRSTPTSITVQINSVLDGDTYARQTAMQNGARDNMTIWTAQVHVPPMAPNQTMLIPVVLDFSFKGQQIGTPITKDDWMSTYSQIANGRFSLNGDYSLHPLNQPW